MRQPSMPLFFLSHTKESFAKGLQVESIIDYSKTDIIAIYKELPTTLFNICNPISVWTNDSDTFNCL